MVKIRNNYLQTTVIKILDELKVELKKRGFDDCLFSKTRVIRDNVQTNCPFHKGGKEKKPSFGINGEIDKCHCFTCGWIGSIEEMVSYVLGVYDEGDYGYDWLMKKFNSLSVETRRDIIPNINRFNYEVTQNESVELCNNLVTWCDYLEKRGFEYQDSVDGVLADFEVGYHPERNTICFPVRGLKGELIYVAERGCGDKFFQIPESVSKPIYGAYRFAAGAYKTCYVTESFFNCLTLWKLGLPAIALMGTGGYAQYPILNNLPVREYILALDPDEAGRKGTERFIKHVRRKLKKGVIYKEKHKDVNDLGKAFLDLELEIL